MRRKKATTRRSSASPEPSARWAKLLRQIPGYDPIATRGDCWFDAKAARAAIDFIETCCSHTVGFCGPLKLERWQKAIVANLFGWKRPDGTRRYREVFIYVPRKNGKTTLIAAIALLVLFTDGERGAQCYCAAADRDQARMVFSQAAGMVQANSAMSRYATCYRDSIAVGNSFLKVLSADAGTKHGQIAHLVVIDELHAQPNPDLVNVLVTGTASRTQPIVIYITTADYDRPGSVCNERHDYAGQIARGTLVDTAFLPVLYEAAESDDWTSPEVWRRVNPNYGVSVKPEYLERECKKAQASPQYENEFKRLHLNMRTQQDVRWLPLSLWDACDAAPQSLAAFRGRPCWIALDLAASADMTACAVAAQAPGGAVDCYVHYWLPARKIDELGRISKAPYAQWVAEGWIETTDAGDGGSTDYAAIERWLATELEGCDIREISIDPYNATDISIRLLQSGYNLVQMRQGFVSMNAPTKEFERLVTGHFLRHGGNPVLRWNVDNLSIEMNGIGDIRPSKKRSAGKIDGAVALMMAVGRMAAQAPQRQSIYETQGVFVG